MSETVFQVLEIFTIILLLSISWFIAWGSIMAVQALWNKIKKMEQKEKKKHEEIIVGRNDELKKIKGDKDQLHAELKALEERKQAVEDFLRENEKEDSSTDDPKLAETTPEKTTKATSQKKPASKKKKTTKS